MRNLAHADDIARHFEDLAVQRFIEMARLQKIGNAIIGIVIDQDRAQQSLLCLKIARASR